MATSSWTFTTVMVDTTPPTVTAQTPAPGATGVAASTTVTATFNEDVQIGHHFLHPAQRGQRRA